MTEKKTDDEISRRNILKKSAVASTTIFGLGSAMNTTAAKANAPEFNIVNRSELSEGEVQAEIGSAMEESAVKNIDEAMRDESDLKRSGVFGVEFETDDPKINKTNPTVVFQGYQSHHRPSEAPGHRSSKAPGKSHHRPPKELKNLSKSPLNAAGLLISIVADTTPDAATSTRKPVMAFGRTAEEATDSIGIFESTSSKLDLKTFTADEDGHASVALQERVEKPTEMKGASSDSITTQDWKDKLGTGACTAIVATLCEGGTGSVSRYGCLKACAPFLGSFWGYGACGAACFAIVDTINNYGCTVGAGTICAAILG